MMDPQSQSPVTEKGHGLVVWKKQADGWKAYLDVMVSDAP
jgi:ketosteroid isomerase-like protein